MLKIRLRRMGAIRQPHYRIVVADSRAPRDGAFIDILGSYNPRTDPATIQVDTTKYDSWKSKGAQPTDAVERLVRQFNRAARKAAAAPEAAAPTATPAPTRRTRSASGKGIPPPPAPAAEAPTAAAAADETTPGEDDTDAPVLEAASTTPEGAAEGETDTDTAS